jgi:segregation and condensation protein B
MLSIERVKQIAEAALLCAEGPLSQEQLLAIFTGEECDKALLRDALSEMEQDSGARGIELKRVASGYRYQVRQELATWIGRLWQEKPPRYSRALLETLALVAYRQPVTRGDIEQVRGVAVSSNIIRTLLERDWIRVVGFKEVPGRPAMYGTTKAFLDYFNLKALEELPPLADIRALLEPVEAELLEAGPEYAAPRVELASLDVDVEGVEDERLDEAVATDDRPLAADGSS